MALIDLIKVLRDKTGAGLMDCKKALLENGEDIDKAIDWLREKGLAKAAKKADRIAAEGLAYIKTCEKCGKSVLVEVNCETDFVAKGDAFKELVDNVAGTILKNNLQTVEEAKEASVQLFTDATVKMGEKFDLRRFVVVQQEEGQYVYSYVHMGGKIGVIVVLDSENAELGKGIAMHVAANNPSYATKEDVPQETLDHEMAIQVELSKNDPKLAGKPAQVLEKILAGKVNKVFAEMILSEQAYLLDDSKTVGQALAEKKVKLVKFVRYNVGEGIEKRKDDFANEVMSQMK